MKSILIGLVLLTAFSWSAVAEHPQAEIGSETMDLGTFSISLTVQDIAASRTFYETLGFRQVAGDQAQNWLVLQNGDAKIGLFQGMFDKNIMTFNPGWASDGEHPEEFTDVRDWQRHLKAAGIPLTTEVDESTNGPGSIVLMDPYGNMILFDQHR